MPVQWLASCKSTLFIPPRSGSAESQTLRTANKYYGLLIELEELTKRYADQEGPQNEAHSLNTVSVSFCFYLFIGKP